jgi:hypothetical protein
VWLLYEILLRSVLRLLVTANFVLSAPILDTEMTEAIRSPETSILTRAENGILLSS